MTYRGRPVLGAVAGLLFGLFVAVDLIMGNAVSSDTNLVVILPVVGLLAGIALALWAPLRWRARPAIADGGAMPAAAGSPDPPTAPPHDDQVVAPAGTSADDPAPRAEDDPAVRADDDPAAGADGRDA